MIRRNDVRHLSSVVGSQVFQRLGYCLSSLGVLSTTLAYTQTIANAQTSANPIPNQSDQRTVQVFPAAPANVATPEIIISPEVAPKPMAAPAALEVPAATVAAPTPSPESRRAADLLPADMAPVAQPSPGYTPPTSVELIETPAPQASAPQVNKAPARSQDKKDLAKTAAKQATQRTTQPAKTPAIGQPGNSSKPIPIVQAAIGSAAPEGADSAVQVGPISLSSAGISYNSTAIQPYFNPQLRLPPMPGLDQIRMVFPIAIPAPITSLFGWRVHPITGAQRLHTGTDVGAPMGTPVMAAMGGRVILADDMGGYGLTVAIEHDNGIRQTLYAHLSEIFVRPGDIVQQGTVVGRVGSTGASTGPHLHFELRQMLPDRTWVAQDASHLLERSMAQLVQSLQIAQQPQRTAVRPVPATR